MPPPDEKLRRLVHDFRNDLSAIDLQAAYIAEIADAPEVLAELARLREIIAATAARLRRTVKPAPSQEPAN